MKPFRNLAWLRRSKSLSRSGRSFRLRVCGIPGQTPDSSATLYEMRLIRKTQRQILRDGFKPNDVRDEAFRRIVLRIPPGKVATYGKVAAAAGYPLYHRAVARLLRTEPADRLPWHRVLGAGGAIKLRDEAGMEQRLRLEMEGVRFRGKRVDMEQCEHLPVPY